MMFLDWSQTCTIAFDPNRGGIPTTKTCGQQALLKKHQGQRDLEIVYYPIFTRNS